MVKYENLVLNTKLETEKIFKFLGRKVTPSILNYIKSHTGLGEDAENKPRYCYRENFIGLCISEITGNVVDLQFQGLKKYKLKRKMYLDLNEPNSLTLFLFNLHILQKRISKFSNDFQHKYKMEILPLLKKKQIFLHRIIILFHLILLLFTVLLQFFGHG